VLVHPSARLPPADPIDFSHCHCLRARLLQRRGRTPDRSRPRFGLIQSRCPTDRHFRWQHTPTLDLVQQEQSREVTLRVHENQMTTAYLSGGGDYLLSGSVRWPHRYKECLVNHAGQFTPGVKRAIELRCGFSPEGPILSETSSTAAPSNGTEYFVAHGQSISTGLRD
jgi:hypothetical protein